MTTEAVVRATKDREDGEPEGTCFAYLWPFFWPFGASFGDVETGGGDESARWRDGVVDRVRGGGGGGEGGRCAFHVFEVLLSALGPSIGDVE